MSRYFIYVIIRTHGNCIHLSVILRTPVIQREKKRDTNCKMSTTEASLGRNRIVSRLGLLSGNTCSYKALKEAPRRRVYGVGAYSVLAVNILHRIQLIEP